MAATLSNAAAAAAHLGPGDTAVDVGGGRGDHAAVWAGRGITAVVADPSPGMISLAARKPGVRAVVARSQSLPFRSATFGLVYFHLSIHYGDLDSTLAEAARVVAGDGRIEIWTLGPRHHASSNLARWFPRVAEIDVVRFPEPSRVVAGLAALGLHVGVAPRPIPIERTASDWVRSVRERFVSTLQFLDDAEIEAGLADFEQEHPDPAEVLVYQLDYDLIVASARPLP